MLLTLAKLNTESPGQVGQALDGCSRGLDFADALHLAASAADEGMFNFDAQFVGVAAAAGLSVHLAGGVRARAGKGQQGEFVGYRGMWALSELGQAHDIEVWSAQVSVSATAIKRIRPVAGDQRRANRVRR